MGQEILLGDEAVGLGAIDAGLSGVFSYPGTPATEIFEFVESYAKRNKLDIHAQWSANEKVAYEEALGMSFAGKKALVNMKHVGLNVAADPFMNSAITGTRGGLVLAVADDPGMHSSQNEQDSRYYAHLAQIPCFEPSNQQEAYDMTYLAYQLSQELELPVMVRLVTRLAHSRANVVTQTRMPQNILDPSQNFARWTLLPTNARVQYSILIEKQPRLLQASENSPLNMMHLESANRKLGVIASGVGYNYFREAVMENELPPYLKIGMYPLPVELIRRFASQVEGILVVEDGYPFIERNLNGVLGTKKVIGKLSGHLPLTGELNPDLVKVALGIESKPTVAVPKGLPARPPQLCVGCGHIDAFHALKEAMNELGVKTAFSDIGCYTLGFYPPFSAISSCVDMGASVSMAKGAADAGMKHVAAVIGDSTFGHSGITPLIGAVQENTPMTLVIMDNGTVAMTGGQPTLTSGQGLINLIKGLGVDEKHIRVIYPHRRHHLENVKVFKEELEYEGLSVIIPQRECIQTARKK